jgi:hypothetical protein
VLKIRAQAKVIKNPRACVFYLDGSFCRGEGR